MYKDQILTYIQKHPVFTTRQIREDLAVPVRRNACFNVELKRLADQGTIRRFKKGIYGKSSGRDAPDDNAFLEFIYLKDGNGYLSGPGLLKKSGIRTGTGADDELRLVSNRVSRNSRKYHAVMRRPKARISSDNKRYFEILDMIRDSGKYAVDIDQADDSLVRLIRKEQLDWGKLIAYANRYYSGKVVDRINFYVSKEYT